MTIQEYIKNYYEDLPIKNKYVMGIEVNLADGFQFDVWMGENFSSSPAAVLSGGNYEKLMAITVWKDELLAPYGRDSVVGIFDYVPAEVINRLIEKHGGIK